ncbi:DUF2188 domain-containing protein [Amphibacillus sp. Q70]|uniref:DUF2188 domain-containing protein n=1 Tax=Amphibacillus sp. Q70 TaxID=3453416 RepID=UPI003F860157
MPWDTNDYPSSLKNLDTAIRKKAIDMANTMVEDGYKEGQAIPIATEQAKKWYANASEQEINQVIYMSDQDLKQSDDNRSTGNPELMEKGEHVIPHENGWAVKAQHAKQPSDVFSTKEKAVQRAEEIAENKQTSVIIHKQDGTIQRKIDK